MKSINFRNIGLIGRQESELVVETLMQLIEYLEHRHLGIIIEDRTSAHMPNHAHQVASRKIMGDAVDVVFVVGGDGCLLGAARDFAKANVPILGINRGRLGFLADILPSDVEEKVGAVLNGEYRLENRFMLEVDIRRGGEPVGRSEAINDVVLHSGQSVKMLEFDVFVDGRFLYRQRSDGLIISTPTGSTAYNLSAGGPIMHPEVEALILLPMYPHTLSSRPMVVGSASETKLVVCDSNEIGPDITCDGQWHFNLEPGDTVYIRQKQRRFQLLHPLDHNFYTACRSKLGWEEKGEIDRGAR